MKRASFFGIHGLACALVLGLTATACGGDDDDDGTPTKPPVKAHIEIEGTWTNSDFGAETDVIDDTTWSSQTDDSDPRVVDIVQFSNSKRYAVRSGADFADPDTTVYDRVVWTKPADGAFYYCTISYGCETAELTATGDGDDSPGSSGYPVCDLSPYDDSDPSAAGSCGAFAWTKLTAE